MSDKDDAFAAVEQAYVEFRDLFVTLPDEAYNETVAGEWTAAQLLAHMAGWYRELAPEFARIVAGNPTPFDGWADADSWNARFAANSLSGSAALDDFDMAFHDFYAAAKAVPDEHFGFTGDAAPMPVRALFTGVAIEHTAEHRRDVEAWLAGRR